MRVALLAESFLPHMNGVTGSVLHVLRHLAEAGHETLVIAPKSGDVTADLHGARTELLRSVPLPSYPEVRVVFARAARLGALLRDFDPDVVHLASPFVLGWQGLAAADALKIPSVAVYQTDVVAYAQKYGLPHATALVAGHVARLHRRATLTLAPSSSSTRQLEQLGVDRIRRWGRGVDAVRFAPEHRDGSWRAEVAPAGQRIVGYVGRLAPEKQVDDLRALAEVADTRLVIVGDGPSRPALEKAIPDAVFTGHLSGSELARVMAGFDVFVHPGESETFGQTIQEALASGVPVVATGVGGPLDLVRSSVDGWLYKPGDLDDMCARVADLVGDESKRRAFSRAARDAVQGRTWEALTRDLVGHYADAVALRRVDDVMLRRGVARPAAPAASGIRGRWTRFVALGDSLTEGLCDASRMPSGQYRGWADRLAELLAHTSDAGPFRYANLAVRSRRVRHLIDEQIPAALTLEPDLVSILIGANDLVGPAPVLSALVAEVESAVRAVRRTGADVLLVTTFLPRRPAARIFARRFAAYNVHLRRIASEQGAILLDLEAVGEIGETSMWADDLVHLSSAGHRLVAYRAAEALGVPDARALLGLDEALHADDGDRPGGTWLTRDALPWVWRRVRGRTAGDGVLAKHTEYVELPTRGDRERADAV
ncbi:glycosyltransferase [Microbacterium sp. KSW2-21]|uniref:D-inositol 3-phosphate glycosyltransferase n=1 Tax=Microbacterium algihabitans TaxID=3075992 RepID=A0ABU3RRS1_9MICO|nr:GDSL-type esterase/lipase family protein [Microbacterium sp. KSW2-21]MDU0325178.1 glycosyltransferase [Microbacterium sp. KSW2-21]